jgi:hypothetical protein
MLLWKKWEHCCCGRSWAIRRIEQGCGKNVTEIRVLHLLHLFFIFLHNYRSSFFVSYKVAKEEEDDE